MKKALLASLLFLVTILTPRNLQSQNIVCQVVCYELYSESSRAAIRSQMACELGCRFELMFSGFGGGPGWEDRLNYEQCMQYCYFEFLWNQFYIDLDFQSCMANC